MVEKIELTFLGTGSTIPTKRRNHPAVLLKYKAENILFDCGEGTQRQFRLGDLNPCKITKILITHWHGDHVLGLPGLLQTLNMNGYNKNLVIYGPRGSKQAFQEMVVPYLPMKHMGYNIIIKEVKEETFFDNDDFVIESAEVDHGCPAVAYAFVVKAKNRLDKEKLEKLKIPNSPLVGELVKGKTVEINGKKIDGKKLMYNEPQRKVAFVMDTQKCDGALKIAKNADVLICEATYSKEDQDIAGDHGHMSSVDAATIAKKAKVNGLVLMHLSQRYEGIPKVILAEAKEIFEDTIIPEDLDEVEL